MSTCPHTNTNTHTFYIHIDQHDMHGKYTYIWMHIFQYIRCFRQHNKKPHTITMILILSCQHISINSTPNITLHVSCALLRVSRHRGSTSSQPVASAFNASWTCKPHVGRTTTSEVQSSSSECMVKNPCTSGGF